MAVKNLNVIIINEHPLILSVFGDILKEIETSHADLNFAITDARDCDEAITILNRMKDSSKKIDLFLIQIDIQPCSNKKYLSGEDIAAEIREQFQKAKIIISTAFKNNYRISTLLKRINPEGFFIRSDTTREALKTSIVTVLEGEMFYSSGVLKFIRKRLDHDISLDESDIRILFELSQGSKMKDLPEVLPFTLGAIEKRKQRIKARFKMEEADDRQLLDQAREYGFI